MERRFEFQDIASLGAIGVGLAVGIRNARSAGVTTDDIVRAYSNVSPITEATPIPVLQKTQISQQDILGRIAKAVQIREDFNSRKLNRIIKGMASEPLSSNELNATKFGLLEYATSPQVDPQVRSQFLAGSDIGTFASDIFEMDEPQIRAQVGKAASISTLSEQRKNLGNIIGSKSRSASRFRGDLKKLARVFNVKEAKEKVKLPTSRPKKVLNSITANKSYSAVLDRNVDRYPLRNKILTLSTDFSNTFEFKGGAEDSYKQIENALEGLGFKNSLNDSLRSEIVNKFKQTQKHIGDLKSRGIIPNTGNLSFTVMGMKGMDQPAIYLNVPFGDSINKERGRVGFQVPLNRPSYISKRGTSTPVYFSTNQPRNPVALNALTMRGATVSEMGELQGKSRLVNTIDAVFFGGSDEVPIERIPFYQAIIESKNVLVPLDNNDPVLNRLAAEQRGVPIEDVTRRLREGNVTTINPLDSLFGTGDDKAKYGQSIVGTVDDAAKVQLMAQRGRMIGITGLSELIDRNYTSKEIFSDIHSQLNNTIYNYGGKYSILRVNAASVSPGQVGIEKGGVSAVSFDLANPEALGITQEEIEAAAKSGNINSINERIQQKITELGDDASGILDEYTHFGLLQGTSDPSGFNQGRRPSQPLVDVFTPTEASVEDLKKSQFIFEGEGGVKVSFFSPLDEIGVSDSEMPSDVRKTRINRRYLFLHPDVQEDITGGVASRVKSSLQEGLSVAITDKVNPEFYGQSAKSRVFLGDTKTVMSERMAKLTEALLSLSEDEMKDSATRKEVIRRALYTGDEAPKIYPKPSFKRGEFLGLKMDARSGLNFSAVDFGGMTEYALEDAYIDGDNLDLEFKPIIKSQQASKVMLSSKTTQLSMSSNEFISAMRFTDKDESFQYLLNRGRIDAVANATEIARAGNLNAIRAQQASALSELIVDLVEANNKIILTDRGIKTEDASITKSVAAIKQELNSLNVAMVSKEGSNSRGYRYSNFNTNVQKAREILKERKLNFGEDRSMQPVVTALEDMLNRPRATSSLLEIVGTLGKLTNRGKRFSNESIFQIFGLEKVTEKNGSLIAGLGAVQEKGKYHAGILGVMSDKAARDLTLEVLGELTKEAGGTSLLPEGFLEETLERIGVGLSAANINTSFIRGQAATTFRTTSGMFEANQVAIERRAIHSILNVNQFMSEDGKINFRNLFLEDLVTQIQGPSRSEAVLAGSLLGNNGLLELARGDEPMEVLSSTTQAASQGRMVSLPFLEGHVNNPTLYMPSIEEEQILQRNIQVGDQVLDNSYIGKIDEVKEIMASMTPEDLASFNPNSTSGQSLINAFNEARIIGYATATDINERFFSGAIIGSIYTLQQSAYEHFKDNLKITDNVILKSSTKGGGLVTMVNKREAERLLQGVRRVASPKIAAQIEEELLNQRTPVLEISTRFPTISGTPRWAGLVQYDPNLDYESALDGSFYKTEVDGKIEYKLIQNNNNSLSASIKKATEVPGVVVDESGFLMRFNPVNTEVRRQGYAVAEVTEGGKTKEVKISLYALSGTTSDDDGDNALRNLFIGGNRQEIQEFLTSEDGRRQMLGYIYNQTSMQRKYEDMVKASPRMEGFEAAAKGSGEILDDSVRALSQHAGQAEIGRVSSSITQLKLLANYGKEARIQNLEGDSVAIKAIEDSYERFMGFLQGLEQVPISFKHSPAGETPSARLTSEIMNIFGNTDQMEAEKAMNEFLMSWMGGDKDEIAKISSEWMDNFMKTAVSFSVGNEDIRKAIAISTKKSEDIAKMSAEEFEKVFKVSMGFTGLSSVTATHTYAVLQSAAIASSIKGNDELGAINKNLQEKAAEVNNKIKANVAEQAKSATLNEKGKAFSKIAKPVGAGLVAAGLIYAMFDQGRSADNLEEPEGRQGLSPPAGIRMNNPQRDTNLNTPYEDREMNYAPNTIDRRTVGSSNTGRINSRAQVSQNVNALEVARAMQSTIPHAQIGVNVQYSNKMNPRLEQDL